MPLTPQQTDILLTLLDHAGSVVSKDMLIEVAWRGTAVTDESLAKAISRLRVVLGKDADGRTPIVNDKRRGFRFDGTVEITDDGPSTATTVAHSDEAGKIAPAATGDVMALLADSVNIVKSVRALETLDAAQVAAAREAFAAILAHDPQSASAHIGLATALALAFEGTRASRTPARDLLRQAEQHALAGCRLAPQSPEAWSALSLVLHRLGRSTAAVAAARKAVELEPGDGVVHHHLRLAFVSGGGERLRAANRVIDSLPGNALARWLASTVFIARGVMDAALDHIRVGCATQDRQRTAGAGKGGALAAVGLHLQHGYVLAATGDLAGAREAFARELAFADCGQIFAAEACANAHYALGALHLREGQRTLAMERFEQALARVADHGPTSAVLDALRRQGGPAGLAGAPDGHDPIALAIAQAVALAVGVRHTEAAAVVSRALTASDVPGPGAAWIVAVEPMLQVNAHLDLWAPTLALIQQRAS